MRINERILKISEINDKTGAGFTVKVIRMLQHLQILTAGVRFQCCHMTASMSGAYNGAQAKFIERLGRTILILRIFVIKRIFALNILVKHH